MREQAKIQNYLQGKAMLEAQLAQSELSDDEKAAIRAQAQAEGMAAGLNLTAAKVAALNAAASVKKVLASPAPSIPMPPGLPPEARYAFLYGGPAAQQWISENASDLIEQYQAQLSGAQTIANPMLTPFPTSTPVVVDGSIQVLRDIYEWNLKNIVPKISEFETDQGLNKGHLTIAALAGEVDKWANNQEIKNMMVDVYGNRIQYLSRLVGDNSCEGKMSMLHYFSESHQAKFNSRLSENFLLINNAKFNSNGERIFWIEESRWNAGEEMYDAIFNQSEKYASFDPTNNILDINKPFNHGIVFDLSKVANVDMFNNPTIGSGANQFLHYENVIYKDKKTINVIMSYCQEQLFYNGKLMDGCSLVELDR